MRTIAGQVILALALFVAGVACWMEARLARRLADAHERLATVHYDSEDGIDETMTVVNRLPWPGGSVGADIDRHRATVSYWRGQYRELMASLPSAGGNTTGVITDPQIMLVAANAAFRASQVNTSDRPATIERLDAVIQAYADALRRAPDNTDASYNYEYVSRFRDAFARSKPPARGATAGKPALPIADVSVDLPAGPTIHGAPGGPPPSSSMERFKTITPLKFDEREQGDPGRGAPARRKG
jgi:hypothetical protein